jgi:hypothetical protein
VADPVGVAVSPFIAEAGAGAEICAGAVQDAINATIASRKSAIKWRAGARDGRRMEDMINWSLSQDESTRAPDGSEVA